MSAEHVYYSDISDREWTKYFIQTQLNSTKCLGMLSKCVLSLILIIIRNIIYKNRLIDLPSTFASEISSWMVNITTCFTLLFDTSACAGVCTSSSSCKATKESLIVLFHIEKSFLDRSCILIFMIDLYCIFHSD